MFRIFFMLTMLFAITFVISNLWIKVIHPFLFQETIEDKLDSAVEQKILSETDKKAEEILNEEALADEG